MNKRVPALSLFLLVVVGCTTTTSKPAQFQASWPSPAATRVSPTAETTTENGASTAATGPGVSSTRGEVIHVRERRKTVVHAKPIKMRKNVPPYSSEAASKNRWARAWMFLDVDAHGLVTRLKLLNPPGYGLNEIAIREAFGLRYSPALDANGEPTATFMFHGIEWPSYDWLIDKTGVATSRYPYRGYVPCRGSGPLELDMSQSVYRDCSLPDLSKLESASWIQPDPTILGRR